MFASVQRSRVVRAAFASLVSFTSLALVVACGGTRWRTAVSPPRAHERTAIAADERSPPGAPPSPRASAPTAGTPTPDSEQRSTIAASDTPGERLARYRALWKSPRHHPTALDEPPRSARFAPGSYACRVSREYRLRACTVERDADGRTFLEFAEGNLLGMRGVIYDHGGAVEFEGWLTEEQPFGCSSCQERCIAYPGSCACDPLPPDAVVECLKQPLRFTLRPTGGGKYHGTLAYRVYYNEYVGDGAARHPEGYVGQKEYLEIDLAPGAPPVSAEP